MAVAYFASDFHLGAPDYASSLLREKKIVRWLDSIKHDATMLFLVGDVFDFWYEYRTVVPKYYTRFLGKLAELSDAGIQIYFFKGNHDMWTFDYLQKELGITVIDEHWQGVIDQSTFFVHHGDALGSGEYVYKTIRKIFRSKWGIWLFHRFHPNFGIGLANYLSQISRKKNHKKDALVLPLEKEYQYQFVKKVAPTSPCNFFVFGHRHLPGDIPIEENKRLINLGDWLDKYTYAVFKNNELELCNFTE